MTREEEIAKRLQTARVAVNSGHPLTGTGFWPTVSKVRRDRELATRFGAEIAEIDRLGFERSVRLRVPQTVGTAFLIAGIAFGGTISFLSHELNQLQGDIVFMAGFGAVLICTHSIAHWIVGRAMGMHFTHYFLGGPPPPRPGIKVDYESYLQVHPRKRAMFHASGAVVTKVLPFLFAVLAGILGRSTWVLLVLLGLGVLQIITDLLFSTKSSDWKKYLREKKASRRAKGWT
jgi:hypothetical protein